MSTTPPDGLTNVEAKAASDAAPAVGLLETLKAQLVGGTLKQGAETMLQAGKSAAGPLDDREMLLENLVDLLAGLPVSAWVWWRDVPSQPCDGRALPWGVAHAWAGLDWLQRDRALGT